MDANTRLQYLQLMGIDVWVPKSEQELAGRSQLNVVQQPQTEQFLVREVAKAQNEKAQMDWTGLQQQVSVCQSCDLYKTRTQTVFGSGDQQADWMLIGEAPGFNEDKEGKPFVGKAGQLLTEMIRAIGQQRDQVYIANMIKCRPPDNRDPKPLEVLNCSAYLQQQIKLLQPKIILVLGRIAAQNLLKTDAPLSKLRGKVHELHGIPLVVVYHPAYLLRSLREKRKAWDDLQLAMSRYQQLTQDG